MMKAETMAKNLVTNWKTSDLIHTEDGKWEHEDLIIPSVTLPCYAAAIWDLVKAL